MATKSNLPGWLFSLSVVLLWSQVQTPLAQGEDNPRIAAAIEKIRARQDRPVPSFFYRINETTEVMDKPSGGRQVYSLETGDLIPFSGVSNGHALMTSDSYGDLYARTKGKATRVDSSESSLIDVYLDVPRGHPVTISSRPGVTWRDCVESVPEEQRPCIAWPKSGPDTRLKILNSIVVEETDPLTGEKRPQLYYQVNVRYVTEELGERHKKGWISAQLVRPDPLESSDLSVAEVDYKGPVPVIKPDCDLKAKPVDRQAKEVVKAVARTKNKAAEKSLGLVGKCITEKKDPAGYKNPFNRFMVRYWGNQKKKGKSYFKYKGKDVKAKEMFAIDALARTVFGEMRGCFRNGIRYPMAVARVILNRAHYVKKHGRTVPFVKAKAPQYKNLEVSEIIPYVTSSSAQFSPWNATDPNLNHILCPKNMDKETRRVWNKSVEIAVAAVLDQKSFYKDTKDVHQLHFSSRVTPNWAKDYAHEKPKVGGGRIDSDRCLKLWGSQESKGFRWQAQQLPLVLRNLLVSASFLESSE